MPVFRETPKTLAYMIDAAAKKFRNDKGDYWNSNILPVRSAGKFTVRATDINSESDHTCWFSFDIEALDRGSELTASLCNNSHQSFRLSEYIITQLTQIYSGTRSDTIVASHEVDAIMSGRLSGESKPAARTELEAPAPGAEPVGLTASNTMLLDALRASLDRLAQLERRLSKTDTAVRHIHQNMQMTDGNVQVVGSRVKGILMNLKATLGYRAKTTYRCASCHSKGEVAVRVKCTQCEGESWWGWWPPN